LPPLFYHDDGGRKNDVPYIYRELFDSVALFREEWGRPISWTGYRCLKHQKELFKQGITTAIISVHCFGLALDGDASSEEEVRSMIKILRRLCPDLRKGWQSYLYKGQSFVHLDTGYLINPLYSKKLYRGAEW